MFNLPNLRDTAKYTSQILMMQSVNFSDAFKDGDIASSRNVSARRWPYTATRHARTKQSKEAGGVEVYKDVTALTAREKLITVKGTTLYYDGAAVTGTVTAGEKQFATVNTKLVIWPDKKYLDMSDVNNLKLVDMGAAKTATGASFTEDTVAFAGATDMADKFKVRDVVDISGTLYGLMDVEGATVLSATASSLTFGEATFPDITACADSANFGPNVSYPTYAQFQAGGTYYLFAMANGETMPEHSAAYITDGAKIYVYDSDAKSTKEYVVTQTTTTEQPYAKLVGSVYDTSATSVSVKRTIPDMDFICSADNRLWGCSSDKQTIYGSALGDPTNFFVYEGLATDSYAVAVGSAGDFTGCIKLQSSVLFWKENTLYKLLGSYPAEFTLYEYTVEGLKKGCHKSLQIVNEVLYYMGAHGVYAFTGGTPQLVSANFGEREFSNGSAGSDGDSYFLSCKDKDDTWYLLVYETHYGIWIQEDTLHCVDFARIGKDLYFLDAGGDVWLEDSGADDADVEWGVQYCPFYDTMEGRKRSFKLRIRTELPLGSGVTIYYRCDGGTWKKTGEIEGREFDVTVIRLPPMRCDKLELKIEGEGPCAILGIERVFHVGSEA